MKKIACLVLIVLLVAIMAVPAFAVVERLDIKDAVYNAYNIAVSDLGEVRLSTHPYVSAYIASSKMDYFSFYFFDTSSPSVGSSVHFVEAGTWLRSRGYDGVVTSVSHDGMRFNIAFTNPAYKSYSYLYMILDFSTACFDGVVAPSDAYINILDLGANIGFLQILLQQSQQVENIGYTPSSWFAFQNAIQSALDLLEQPEYTQEQIDDAFEVLQDAKNALALLPDTSGLERLLAACKALSSGSYTPSSYAALNTAMIEAETVLAFIEYTEQQITEAYSALESARYSLVELPNTAELESLLAACKVISVDSYTAKSYSVLQAAIKQAEKLLSRPDYTDSDIADMISELQIARDGLIEMSAQDLALKEALVSLMESLLSNISVITPICLGIFAIGFGIQFVPRIFKTLTKS